MSSNNIYVTVPTKEHTHTIILLHGRDSTASEFFPEFFESQASDDRTLLEIFPHVKWVFPTSKIRNSAHFHTEISQWFDIWSVEDPEERSEIQIDGLKESIAVVLSVIREEAKLVGEENIALGGISQGCATAISALLCNGERLGGFIGFSSWFPCQTKIEAAGDALQEMRRLYELYPPMELSDHREGTSDLHSALAIKTPVFLAHSKDDDVVPIQNGVKLAAGLEKLGMHVTWRAYEDGGHWVNEPQGIDDMVEFLQRAF